MIEKGVLNERSHFKLVSPDEVDVRSTKPIDNMYNPLLKQLVKRVDVSALPGCICTLVGFFRCTLALEPHAYITPPPALYSQTAAQYSMCMCM